MCQVCHTYANIFFRTHFWFLVPCIFFTKYIESSVPIMCFDYVHSGSSRSTFTCCGIAVESFHSNSAAVHREIHSSKSAPNRAHLLADLPTDIKAKKKKNIILTFSSTPKATHLLVLGPGYMADDNIAWGWLYREDGGTGDTLSWECRERWVEWVFFSFKLWKSFFFLFVRADLSANTWVIHS